MPLAREGSRGRSCQGRKLRNTKLYLGSVAVGAEPNGSPCNCRPSSSGHTGPLEQVTVLKTWGSPHSYPTGSATG